MRNITGHLINSQKFHYYSRIIISGSSGTGKTTFALKLIENQHFNRPIKKVYYFSVLGSNNLEWHNKLPDIDVHYMDGMPSSDFFENIPPNSIGKIRQKIWKNITLYFVVIIDDQFKDAIECPAVARAFQFDSRHQKFSIILVTQVCLTFVDWF